MIIRLKRTRAEYKITLKHFVTQRCLYSEMTKAPNHFNFQHKG
jgi:hypothetical protein